MISPGERGLTGGTGGVAPPFKLCRAEIFWVEAPTHSIRADTTTIFDRMRGKAAYKK